MKKILIAFSLLLILVLTGCKGEAKTNENNGKIRLEIDEAYLEFLDYSKEIIPYFEFIFDGTIYTSQSVRNQYEVLFTGNDDFVLSDILSKFFQTYQELPGRFSTRVISIDKKAETIMNSMNIMDGKKKFEKHYLKVHENMVYNEIAFFTLENGLQLTLEYRRFVSENNEGKLITYYAWQYAKSMRMFLHYPLMVYLNEENEKKLVILPLPNGITYTVGTTIELSKLLTGKGSDKYITDEGFRSFPYKNLSMDPKDPSIVLEEEVAHVKNYYNSYLNGREVEGKYYFTYLERDYEVRFYDTSFSIDYIGKSNMQ